MKWIKLIPYAIVTAVIFAAYLYGHNRGYDLGYGKGHKEYTDYKSSVDKNSELLFQQQQQQKIDFAKKTQENDDKHLQELLQNDENTQAILDSIHSGNIKLQYDTGKANSGSREGKCGLEHPSMGNEASQAKHNKKTLADVINIGHEADEAIIQLNACQDKLNLIQETYGKK